VADNFDGFGCPNGCTQQEKCNTGSACADCGVSLRDCCERCRGNGCMNNDGTPIAFCMDKCYSREVCGRPAPTRAIAAAERGQAKWLERAAALRLHAASKSARAQPQNKQQQQQQQQRQRQQVMQAKQKKEEQRRRLHERAAFARVIPVQCGTSRATSISSDVQAFMDSTLAVDVAQFPDTTLQSNLATLSNSSNIKQVFTFSELFELLVNDLKNPLELLLKETGRLAASLDIGLRKVDEFIASKHGVFARIQLPIVKDHVRQAMVGIVDE